MNAIQTYFNQMRQEATRIANAVEAYAEQRDKNKDTYQPTPFLEWENEQKIKLIREMGAAENTVVEYGKKIIAILEQNDIVSAKEASAGDVALFSIPNLSLSENDLNAIIKRNPGNQIVYRLVRQYMDNHSELDPRKIMRIKTVRERISAAESLTNEIAGFIGSCDLGQDISAEYFCYSIRNIRDKWEAIFGDKIKFVADPNAGIELF